MVGAVHRPRTCIFLAIPAEVFQVSLCMKFWGICGIPVSLVKRSMRSEQEIEQ